MIMTQPEQGLWQEFRSEFKPTIWKETAIDSPERYAPQIRFENGKAVHYVYVSESIEPSAPGRVWAWFERHYDNDETRAQSVLVVCRHHFNPNELETTDLRMAYALRRGYELWGIYPDVWVDYIRPKAQ